MVRNVLRYLDDPTLCALGEAQTWGNAPNVRRAIATVSRENYLGVAKTGLPAAPLSHPALAPTPADWLNADSTASLTPSYPGALRRRVAIQTRLSPVPFVEHVDGMASRTRSAKWPTVEQHDALGAALDLLLPQRRELGGRVTGWAHSWAEDFDTQTGEAVRALVQKRAARSLMLLNLAGPALRESAWGHMATAAALVGTSAPRRAQAFWLRAHDVGTRTNFRYDVYGSGRRPLSARDLRCGPDVFCFAAQVAVTVGDVTTLAWALKQAERGPAKRAMHENARFLLKRALWAGELSIVHMLLPWHTEPFSEDRWGIFLALASRRLIWLETQVQVAHLAPADAAGDRSALAAEITGLRSSIGVVFGHCSQRLEALGHMTPEALLWHAMMVHRALAPQGLRGLGISPWEGSEAQSLATGTPLPR